MVAFSFPALANVPGTEHTKNDFLGGASGKAFHEPSLIVASVLLSCVGSFVAFVCCGAACARAGPAGAAPTSTPGATRYWAEIASNKYFPALVDVPVPENANPNAPRLHSKRQGRPEADRRKHQTCTLATHSVAQACSQMLRPLR